MILSPNPHYITTPTQKVVWIIKATNNGPDAATPPIPITVTLAWSDTIVYHRISSITDLIIGNNFGDGTAAGTNFDQLSGVWTAGYLLAGQSKYLYIETSFAPGTNLETVLPLTLTKTITITGVPDADLSNNIWTDTLTSEPECEDCPPVAAPVSGIGCLCSVATNDGLCTSGISKFELVPLSFINTVEGNLNWDVNSGTYTKFLTDPGLDGSFQYNIVCYKNGLPVSTWGPATETIPAIFDGTVYSMALSLDGLSVEFLRSGVVVSTIQICDIVDTCSPLLIGDLTP